MIKEGDELSGSDCTVSVKKLGLFCQVIDHFFKLTALLSSSPKKLFSIEILRWSYHKMIYLVNKNPLHGDSIWHIN